MSLKNIPYYVDTSTNPWTVIFDRYMYMHRDHITPWRVYPKVEFPFMTEHSGGVNAIYKICGDTPYFLLYKFDARSVKSLDGAYRIVDNSKEYEDALKTL